MKLKKELDRRKRRDLGGRQKKRQRKISLSQSKDRLVVGILDSGLDYNHPNLAFRILRKNNQELAGWDFENEDREPR